MRPLRNVKQLAARLHIVFLLSVCHLFSLGALHRATHGASQFRILRTQAVIFGFASPVTLKPSIIYLVSLVIYATISGACHGIIFVMLSNCKLRETPDREIRATSGRLAKTTEDIWG